jgi:hypothetical protein
MALDSSWGTSCSKLWKSLIGRAEAVQGCRQLGRIAGLNAEVSETRVGEAPLSPQDARWQSSAEEVDLNLKRGRELLAASIESNCKYEASDP